MLISIALIILTSLLLQTIFNKLKLPGILGILIAGILIGPHLLNLIDPTILDMSSDLREIALIVILVRAGLSLDLEDLKKVGRPAILLSFVPASIEIIAITLVAPLFFDISYISAATLGAIVAAVSPAVVVPRMIKLIHQGYGNDKKIPQMILAAASIDDVYAIIIFYALIKYQQGGTLSILTFVNIPLSIILGALLGIIVGYLIVLFFKKFHFRDTIKVLVMFSLGFLILALENVLSSYIAISGLIAVIAFAMTINKTHIELAKRLVRKFEKIWVVAEIMLFVLVGALIDISVLIHVGLFAILLILLALVFRIGAVYIATLKTPLNAKERLFTAFSYTPKATVQAAIGAIPLSVGLPYGEFILMVSVLAIMITAPFGAILMDHTFDLLLIKDKQ